MAETLAKVMYILFENPINLSLDNQSMVWGSDKRGVLYRVLVWKLVWKINLEIEALYTVCACECKLGKFCSYRLLLIDYYTAGAMNGTVLGFAGWLSGWMSHGIPSVPWHNGTGWTVGLQVHHGTSGRPMGSHLSHGIMGRDKIPMDCRWQYWTGVTPPT